MLTGEAKKEYQRRYMKAQRAKEGSNSEGLTDYPHIIDKLVDPKWRSNLTYLCSHLRRDEKEVTWLGDYNLSLVCDWLQCTS